MLDEPRLKHLVDAYLDQTLEPAEREELEWILMSSEQARQDFWSQVHLHASAREWAIRRIASGMVDSTVNCLAFVRKDRIRKWTLGIGAVAAVLALGGIWRAWQAPDAKGSHRASVLAENPDPVAVLALAADTEWIGRKPTPGSPLPPGMFQLARGTARIDFLSGAQMTIQAPAEVELITEMRANLRNGNIHVFAPPAAVGFTVVSGDMIAVDRGTEFGMTGALGHGAALHVLKGTVAVARHDASTGFRDIRGGEAVSLSGHEWSFFPAEPGLFHGTRDLADEASDEQGRRLREWEAAAREFSARPDVVIHLPFLKPELSGETQVANTAANASEGTDGTMIGAEWVSGRWADKGACSFSRSTDRVRFVAPGTFDSMTVMAWVRVDRLPNDFNVLLRADRTAIGTPHWQFDSLGRLRFGYYTGKNEFLKPDSKGSTPWDVAVSPPLLDGKLGQWIHVTTVYDSQRAVLEHFMNGSKVASHPLLYPLPIVIGAAQIGNSVMSSKESYESRLNLVGRLDEFALLKVALPEDAIRDYYEKGRP